jgi:hypothetical protein
VLGYFGDIYKISHHFVGLDELILIIYILSGFDKIFNTIFNFTHTNFVDFLILWIYCNIYIYIIKKFNYFSLIVILTVTLLVTLDCNFVSNFGGYFLYI